MTWLALIFVMIQCYHVFIAAVINVIHIPVNLVTFGIFDLVAAVYFWLPVYKKKETQKYIYGIVDVVFLILVVVAVAWFARNRYYGFHLSINYKTVDPAPRFREAMDFVNDQSISRMFYAQVVNGTMIELLAPFERVDYYYRFYVLSDVVQLLMSGVMFFGVIRKYIKGKFLAAAGVIASLIFLLGYPLNSTIYGFTYLGMSLTLVAMLFVVSLANSIALIEYYPPYFPWVVMGTGAVTSIPTLLFYFKEEPTKLQARIRVVIHFCLIQAIVMTEGFLLGWYKNLPMALLVFAMFTAVYLLTFLFSYITRTSTAKSINESLKRFNADEDYQDE